MPTQPDFQPESNPDGVSHMPGDFVRTLHIAHRSSKEFESLSRSGISAPVVVAMSFVPIVCLGIITHLALVRTFGVPIAISLPVCAALTLGTLMLAFAHLIRPGEQWEDFFNQTRTDSRYRVRAVIPKNRRTRRLTEWALQITGRTPRPMPESTSDLNADPGGFEPVILRPWLGIGRSRAYWTTAALLATSTLAGLAFMHWHHGTFASMLTSVRIWAYAGLIAGVALGGAELLFPVYLRLSPGRLEVLRYPPFGRTPSVTTYDLRAVGLCVDFSTAIAAVEPPRPPGTPVPPLVLSDRWPYHAQHPPEHRPFYVCVALCLERSEFCQRLVQAALAQTHAPPLPHDGLTG